MNLSVRGWWLNGCVGRWEVIGRCSDGCVGRWVSLCGCMDGCEGGCVVCVLMCGWVSFLWLWMCVLVIGCVVVWVVVVGWKCR